KPQGFEIILRFCTDGCTDLLGKTDQIHNTSCGGCFAKHVLQLRKQYRLQSFFDITATICSLCADDLRYKLLWVFYLKRKRAESLEQSHTQAHARVADDDRLRRAPFLVREFLHRNKIHFCGEGCALVKCF